MSKSDDRYYKRLAAADKARSERRKRLKDDLPRRMAILAMVKAGDISLVEAQRLIKNGTAIHGKQEGRK